jgi:TusA-related sulfurtransferase
VTPIRVIDALGTHCPVPVRLLAAAAVKADPGALIELLADDPLAEIDVPAWCHSHGHRVSSATRDGGIWVFVIAICSRPPIEPGSGRV